MFVQNIEDLNPKRAFDLSVRMRDHFEPLLGSFRAARVIVANGYEFVANKDESFILMLPKKKA